MAALQDLQASLASLTTSVDSLIAVVKTPPTDSVSAADVDPIVAQMNSLKASVDAALAPPAV